MYWISWDNFQKFLSNLFSFHNNTISMLLFPSRLWIYASLIEFFADITKLTVLLTLAWKAFSRGKKKTRIHSSRMRTVHCSGCPGRGGPIVCPGGCLPREGGICWGRVSAQGGVCQVQKHYLAITTLRTVITSCLTRSGDHWFKGLMSSLLR